MRGGKKVSIGTASTQSKDFLRLIADAITDYRTWHSFCLVCRFTADLGRRLFKRKKRILLKHSLRLERHFKLAEFVRPPHLDSYEAKSLERLIRMYPQCDNLQVLRISDCHDFFYDPVAKLVFEWLCSCRQCNVHHQSLSCESHSKRGKLGKKEKLMVVCYRPDEISEYDVGMLGYYA